MAKKSAQLFVGQAQPPAVGRRAPKSVADIQLRALQMLFDIVMVFHFNGLEREGGAKDGVSGSTLNEKSLLTHDYPPSFSNRSQSCLLHLKVLYKKNLH